MDALVQPNEKRIDIMESAGRKLVAKFLWKQMVIRWLCCASWIRLRIFVAESLSEMRPA